MLKMVLGATLLLAGVGAEDVKELNVKEENQAIQVISEAEQNNPVEYLLKPEAFNLYLEAEKLKSEKNKVEILISTDKDMIQFIKDLYQDLPYQVTLKSKFFNTQQLKEMFEKAKSYQTADSLPEIHGLASYKISEVNKSVRILDNTNKEYTAAIIKKAFDAYTDDLIQLLKEDNEVDTILNVYDYVFGNFQYSAEGFRYMTVGNIGNSKMACNGFSYFVDTLLEKMDIKSEIRAGYSHYWNVVTLSTGEEITFDVTSDIVLKEYKATLGLSTEEHILKTSNIGFFSAEFLVGTYNEVKALGNKKLFGNKN